MDYGVVHIVVNLHFFNICRHHPTLKFKPHATDDERYVSGIDGVPLSHLKISLNHLKISLNQLPICRTELNVCI